MSKVMVTASGAIDWGQFPNVASYDVTQRVNQYAASEAAVSNPAATEYANSNEIENTNGSEQDITPASTSSVFTATRSGLQSPASSVCTENIDRCFTGQGVGAERDFFQLLTQTECQATPSAEQAVRPTAPTQSSDPHPRASSKLWRFLSSTNRSSEPNQSQATECVVARVGGVVLHVQDKDKIYAFRGVPGLYVAFEDLVRPPAELLHRWEQVTEPRFWTDAREFQNKIMKTKTGRRRPPGMSLELRMSGYASTPHSTHVELLPKIWVLYDDNRWARDIKKFVRESEWLQHEGFGEVEVRRGSPRLATFDPPMFSQGLTMDTQNGFPFGNNSHLYLHVERRPGTSAVGLLCCATIKQDGIIRGQRLSRLGGLVSFNNGTTTLAITTAHGILELAWDAFFDDASDLDDFPEGAESSSDAGYESDGSSDIDNTPWSDALPTSIPTINMEEVHQWDTVEILGVTSFLGNTNLDLSSTASTMEKWTVKLEHPPHDLVPREDTDFSLWCIPRFPLLKNSYLSSVSKTHVQIQDSSSDLTSSDPLRFLDSKPVTILLGPELQIQAHVVPGVSHFMVHGKVFTTHKIRMKAALGPGCSGSWVVKGPHFFGMVVASYECEPSAHIVTCSDLLSAIKCAVPQAHTVQVDGKVSPLIWSKWNQSVQPTTRLGHTDRGGGQDGAPNTVPTSQVNKLAGQELANMISVERKVGNRPTIPLHTTTGTLAEIEGKLVKVKEAIEKVSVVFHVWYSMSKDTVRAKALINLKLHMMDQYHNDFAQKRGLKQYLSITPEALDSAYNLVCSIARDLAIAFPIFLKASKPVKQTNLPADKAERMGSLSDGVSVAQNAVKRPLTEIDCLYTGDASSSSSTDITTTKRRKVPQPERESVPGSYLSPEASSPRKSQRQLERPEGQLASTSDLVTKGLLEHRVLEDPWANSTIDPLNLFATYTPLANLPPNLHRNLEQYQEPTPNPTPELIKDSGSSAPSSNISESMNLDIDFSWHAMDQACFYSYDDYYALGLYPNTFEQFASYSDLPRLGSMTPAGGDLAQFLDFPTTVFSKSECPSLAQSSSTTISDE